MHQGWFFAGFALMGALCIVAAKWLDDAERRRTRTEARGRSSFPPRASMPGDPKALPRHDDARSSGH